MSSLDDLEALLARMSDEDKAELDKTLEEELSRRWLPSPGPQTDAYFSEADLLLFGGAAGGGKSELLLGLALEEHHESVIFRRQFKDLRGLARRLQKVSGTHVNKSEMVWAEGDHIIELGHLEAPGAEDAWQGRPHDFIGFDEGAQLTAYKVNFVLGWLRSAEGHRCRAVIASNPPIGGEGQWLVEWFAPWLDPAFDNPAEPGELRWAITLGDEDEIRTKWVDGPEPVVINGETYYPLSRTFIPSKLDDNPYLRDTNYRAQINSMPEPLRSQLLHGDFMASRQDAPYQVIPTDWVLMAHDRWRRNQEKPLGPMLHLGVDVAQGGSDNSVVAPLHGVRFEDLIKKPGKETPDGPSIALMVLANRRDDCGITIDLTGGWGGSARDHLRTHHKIEAEAFVASEGCDLRTADGKFGFINQRAASWWTFREALDPSKDATMELPPDPRLQAQLTSPTWKLRGDRIQVEMKEDIRKRLGSSTDDADAVIMAWFNRGVSIGRHQVVKPRDQSWVL